MKKNYKLKTRIALFAAGLTMAFSFNANAQVDVTATLGTPNASYSTLGAAFTAVNGGTHQGAISIALTASTTETATAVLNASGSGLASYTGVTVFPAASAPVTISGAITAGSPLIDLNGADNVVFDGLNTGGNTLTISNTTASAVSGTSTIRLIGGATFNTITRCTVLGSFAAAVGTNGGNIFFSTDAVSLNGNDNNSVTLCDITSSASGLTTKGVYGNGSTTSTANNNSGNLISGNNIYDYFGAAVSSAGVYIAGGCTDWTVSNNKFYQTAPRTQTTGAQHSGIWITNTTSGNNYLISNNIIGYASNSGTGVYSFTGVSSSSVLVPIHLNVGTTTASSVQGNTIAGIAMSGLVSGTSSSAAFRGIYVASGLTIVGDVTGNTIGSQSSTGSITFTSSSTSTSDIIGIFNFGSSNWVSNNNTVGGITASNSSTGAANIYGIRCFTGSGVNWTCNNNIVGGTVANSIQSTSTATGTVVVGILNSAPIGTVTGNIIRNLSTAGGTGTGTTASISGILSNASSNQNISDNIVSSLMGTGASTIVGISLTSGSTSNISKNKIYNLEGNNAGAAVYGMSISSGTTTTIFNNVIGDLRAPVSTNTTDVVRGFSITGGTTVNVYYNTVMINGTSSGANFSTSAINASSTPTVTLRNNIFVNNSTPAGTGLAVAYKRSTATLTTYGSTSNNNIYYAGSPSATNLIFYDGTNADQTLGAFQVRVAPRDADSRTENVSFVSTTGSSASFLHINTATPSFAESGAVNITTFTTDYDNDIRQGNGGYAGTGTAPDIGADEFEGTPVPVCAGTPVAGTIVGAAAVCSGTGTTLNLSGAATDPGVTYQWASSTTMGGPYTNMGTALAQATGNLTTTMYYVVTTTCTFSGLSATTPEYTLLINSNPTVSVTPPTADFCIGGSPIALTALGASTYVWTPAAGLSATTGSAVNATPALTTTYTVTGTDANGCIGTATSAITANEIPSLSSVTATPSSVCSGGNSQLMATATTTSSYVVQPATYNLETPAGTPTNIFTTGDDAISPSIAIPFSFNFFGQTFTNVFVSTNGFIQLGANSGTSMGATIPTAAVPNNVIAGIWDDLNVIGAGSPTVRYFTNGTAPNRKFIIEYSNVKFYNTAANNGNASFQIKIFEGSNVVEVHLASAVDPTPSAHYLGIENGNGTLGYSPAGRNPYSTDITVPEAWAFVPNGGSITYAWSPATFLSSATINNPMANGVTATTTYTVTATSATCSTSSTVTITAGSALTSSSNITPASAVCLGTTVTLNSVPSGGGAPYTFAWSGPAGFSSTAQNPSFPATMAEAGTYTVTVTDNCSATSTSTVTLAVNGLPTVSVTPSTAIYCMSGTAVALSASGTSTSYSWLPAAGLSAATGADVDASPTATTTYTVTGTDGNGCTSTATAVITSAPAVSVGTVTASPATLCAGSNSNLLASASSVPAAYCSATTTSTSFEKISNVTFGTINNTSSATAGYENFTAMSTNITAGVAIPITMGISAAYATDDRVHVWIDMNNDGVFADPAENVLNLAISTFCPTCSGTATTINGTITVPVTALNGATRMRIRLQDASATVNNSTPCGVAQYGQVEDYTVNISGGADNGITYSWAPATYLSSTSISNPVATAVTNNISYTVTATSVDGCSATGSTTITVNQLPTIMAMSNDADNTICAGSSITLSGMGAVSYSWTGGVTDATPFTPTATDTYTVTGTDANGCMNTATATVTVNPLPTIMAMSNDADNTICAGSSITLSGMGAVSYSWTGGVTDAAPFTPTATDTYTVTGTDANGCMNTATATVTVNPLPTIMAMSNDADNTICAGSSITLSGMGAVSYSWTGGITDATPFTPTATDTYTVTGTDANGCMNTATATVTVNPLPSVMGMSSDMDNTICSGSSVTLTGMGAVSYSWTGGVTDATPFSPTTTDTYTVTGTDANGCMNTATITVTVNSLPTVTAMSDDADNTICDGSMITLSGMGAASYTWTGGISDAVSFAPAATDTYTVTGTDANGCMNTNTITVTVNTLPAVSMSAFSTSVCDNGGPVSLGGGSPAGGMYSGTGVSGTTFDPTGLSGMYLITYTVTDANSCSNSDTASITVDLCSGIASNTESAGVKIYPNPASGMVNVSIAKANSEQIAISIVDIQGKQVYNEISKNITTEFNKQINIEGFAKGVYYIKITTENNTQIHKLIVH